MTEKKNIRERLPEIIGWAVFGLAFGLIIFVAEILPDFFGVYISDLKLFPPFKSASSALTALIFGLFIFAVYPVLIGVQTVMVLPYVGKKWDFTVLSALFSLYFVLYAVMIWYLFHCRYYVERHHGSIISDTTLIFIIFGYLTVLGLVPAAFYKPIFDLIDKFKRRRARKTSLNNPE